MFEVMTPRVVPAPRQRRWPSSGTAATATPTPTAGSSGRRRLFSVHAVVAVLLLHISSTIKSINGGGRGDGVRTRTAVSAFVLTTPATWSPPRRRRQQKQRTAFRPPPPVGALPRPASDDDGSDAIRNDGDGPATGRDPHKNAAGGSAASHGDDQRRRVLRSLVTASSMGAAAFGLSSVAFPSSAAIAAAAATTTTTAAVEESSGGGLVSTARAADLLRAVPTFTIVDPKGVPYMVVGEDAKITGYFFTEYGEAARILEAARTSAARSIARAKRDKVPEAETLTNPWSEARISTVPLDTAVTLVTKTNLASSKARGYFQIAPSERDIEDALTVTGKSDLAEGKVPLFYYESFNYTDPKTGTVESPLYFHRSELIQAYKQQQQTLKTKTTATSEPPVLVTELFSVLGEMVKPGGTDAELRTLVFVPPAGSVKRARECLRNGGGAPPFVVGQRNLVL